jgi:hypothetical protein
MSMVRRSCVLGVLLTVGGPALAQAASPAAIIEPSADQVVENKVVCKSEAKTGTRFSTRVCHTSREWAEIREQNLRAMNEMQAVKLQADTQDRNTPN